MRRSHLVVNAFKLLAILMITQLAQAQTLDGNTPLDGIGYREQELQVAKGSTFDSEEPTGISWASFAGGTNIFIKAPILADNAQSNVVRLRCDLLGLTVEAPRLTEDDAFNSNTAMGFITYRLPAVDKLLGVPSRVLDQYQTLSFELSLFVEHDLFEPWEAKCSSSSKCMIHFKKPHTPVVYELNPPVVYFNSETHFWFDPKSVPGLLTDLASDEMAFINAKIGGALVDFEGFVDFDDSYRAWERNYVKGRVGDQPPSKQHDISMLWEVGQSAIQDQESLHCSYDNQTCYVAQTVPVIFNVSSNTGFKTGGQELTVTGHGFQSSNIDAKVDGLPCIVTSNSKESFTCEVPASVNASTIDVPYVGQHGVRKMLVNSSLTTDNNHVWLDNFNDMTKPEWTREESLALNMEMPPNTGDRMSHNFTGWFHAPATTRYRFYMACDDDCRFSIDTTPGSSSNATKILDVSQYSNWRDYWRMFDSSTRISDWVELNGGEHYFVQMSVAEGTGGDHISAAVEIEQTAIVGHHHAMKQIQNLRVNITNNKDTTEVTVLNPDDGEYVLNFQDPNSLEYTASAKIPAKASRYTFYTKIQNPFCNKKFRSVCDVTLKMYDANDTEVFDMDQSVKNVYRMEVRKLISGISSSKILVAKTSTSSTVTAKGPSEMGQSSTPLSGKYRIKCVTKGGVESFTQDINWHTWSNWIAQRIMEDCNQLYDKIEVYEGNEFSYKEQGVNVNIRFLGINEDQGKFEIVQSETSPLQGDNLTFESNITQHYSTNLFYEPIPFEFLKTYETKPQLMVSVDGQPALCHNLNCDFTYIEPVGEVTAFTYDASTKKAVLTGTSFPNNTVDVRSVEFAHTACVVDSATLTETNLECTLVHDPTCGDFKPILVSNLGLIPNAVALAPTTVQCTIVSATPTTNLNLLGGDDITITGTNFPKLLAKSTVDIKFSDTQTTSCNAHTSSSTTLVCTTGKFDSASSAAATLNPTVTINSQVVTNSLDFTLRSEIKSTTGISPSSVSPVLKTPITVTLESTFPYALKKEDITMHVTNNANSTIIKHLRCVSVDDAAKTFVAMFGGAESGVFSVTIRHKDFGLVGTQGMTLNVGSTVTAVSPMTGSIYGGTVLTITGTNFGSQKTDNPVQISYNGGVGSTNCFVLTTAATQITCQIDSNISMENGKQGTVVVFLKTSEEAVCDNAVCGSFTYTSALPTITAAETVFDSTANNWEVKLTGTGLPTSTTNSKMTVGSNNQVAKSSSATEAFFTLTNVTSQNVTGLVSFIEGKPAGHNIVDAGLAITPKFVSISPNVGSIGGTTIVATVPGVVKSLSNVAIKDASGAAICDAVRIVDYGLIECDTKKEAISSSVLKVSIGSDSFECVNSDAAACTFEQVETAMPSVASVAATASTIVFTGTDFKTTGYTAKASFNGIKANTVVTDSATQVTATWTLGVPVVVNATKPSLSFLQDGARTAYWAKMTADVTNPLTVTANTQGLSCSFAGGCELEVTANGLATMMKESPSNNYLSVCENKCTFDEAGSSASAAKCKLPQVSTLYSDTSFKIQSSHKLEGMVVSSSNADKQSLIIDNDIHTMYVDSNSECHVTFEFKQGYTAILDKVKLYLDSSLDKVELFNDKLKFQGSNDGTTFTDIFKLDQSAHSGWNYFEWTENQPKYRFYKLAGSADKSCKVNEVELWGIETIDNNAAGTDCQAKLVVNGVSQTLSGTVQYQGSLTPALTSMNPRYGRVEGGTSVTFTGTDFSATNSDYTILIDKIACVVTAATSTSVTCTTGPRPGLHPSSLSIYIQGRGYVSLKGQLFGYVNAWSSDITWGGEFAPLEGESVYVPKGLNLLVDVDSTPVLKIVIVEGSLIFAPDATNSSHHRTFDANYVFVNEGRFEVGTEEHPYTSKVTITLHGKISDPYLPIYGNKVLALRKGHLDMHGPERTRTWTVLEETAEANSTTIKLREAVDWQVGEQIAIAPTTFEARDAEKKTIMAIDRTNPDKPVITLDSKLTTKRFAMTQTFGDQEIDMRAEVGLLSRNVKLQGDSSSEENQYGATVFLHSMGDDSLTARLENVEFTNMGQAFKLGRYAIHFHMIGNVHNSYIKGNSVHQSFNRAFTMHGTSYLRILKNVVYNVMGHNVFIEDAVERHNQIHDNLIIMTKRSWSLLNTDQTPASFWITNPNNDFTGNHAAGSDRYSYWYDLQIHAMGPSANNDICPENERVGKFENNHAHSNGRYGLRIFHNMVPREFPCKPVVYDHANTTDPFWKNPLITANFYNLTSWKNKRNGAIAGNVGDVRFHNFKTADNILAGIEFERTSLTGDNRAQVKDSLIIGKTANTEELLELAKGPHGIIAARSENFTIDGAKFYNYNWNNAAALGDCSHCFHPAATDAGARHTTVRNLQFDEATVPRKIRYQFPFLGIFKDETGTLTGKGANSWAAGYTKHNEAWPECETDREQFDGQICDNTVQVRRLAWHGATKSLNFFGQAMYVLPWDDSIRAARNETEYVLNRTEYGKIFFKEKTNPGNSWTFPFVTGHKYKVHWSATGNDFETMKIEMSEKWEHNDKNVYVVHNYTDVRAIMDVDIGSQKKIFGNDTLPSQDITYADYKTGQNILYNETDKRQFHMVFTGKNVTKENRLIKLTGHRCNGSCLAEIEEVQTENRTRYWSQASDWPDGVVPGNGSDITILSGWNMIFDMEESPLYQVIQINGILTFKNDSDRHLHAEHIFVRAGQLHIGSAEYPFQHKARITLHGLKEKESIVYDNAIEAGNKILANVGLVSMFGIKRTQHIARLHAMANKGDTQISIDKNLDLVPGDRIALAATSFDMGASDDALIVSYDNSTGVTVINTPLNFTHFGAAESTASKYNGADIRGEVMILSRNIIIAGEDVETWGGQIVTSDTIESDLTVRSGQTIMHNVEIHNCSQINTMKAAVRFEGASGKWSHLSGVSIHNGHGWGMNIEASANIRVDNSILFSFKPIGFAMQTVTNVTVDNNIVAHIYERSDFAGQGICDNRAAYTVCALKETTPCTKVSLTNNIAAGAAYAGFIVPGHECGDLAQTSFRDNVAHSVNGANVGVGAVIYPAKNIPAHSTCYEGSFFTGYKCARQGMHGFFSGSKVQYQHNTFMDNHLGAGPQLFGKESIGDYKTHTMEINHNTFYGETEIPDCPENGGYCIRLDKFAVFPPASAVKGKNPHITGTPALPMEKIKGDSAWGPETKMVNNTFIGFKAKTTLEKDNSIFGSSGYQADYTPMLQISDSKFIDIHEDAFAHFADPKPGWAIIKDCGNYPCTAPHNILYSFKNSEFSGVKPSFAAPNFQLIGNNSGFAPYVQECTPQPGMNAYSCQKDSLSILRFESQDTDRMDRSVQPVYLNLQGTDMKSNLNSEMDHVWDGFYTGQLRQTRFPGVIDAVRGGTYDITYTGTPPKKQLFELYSLDPNAEAVIRIAYPSAMAYQVKKDGNYIDMNQWSDLEKNYGPIQRTFCGENRYLGVQNILEFYIVPGCSLIVEPRNAIQTKVRMEWTLEDFYAKGGTTTFVDRLAASLGIHASTIKVVGVYTGSLVIDYNIFADNDDTTVLQNIQQTQVMQIATGTLDLGAPVLDFQQDSAPIVSDGVVTAPNYDPVILTPTITNSGANYQPVTNGGVITNTKQALAEDIREQSTFSPSISIVEEEFEPEVHIAESRAQVQVVEPQTNTVYMVIGIVILFVILLVVGIRAYVKLSQQQMIDRERIKQGQEDYQIAEMNSVYETTAKKGESIDMTAIKNVEQYAVQYDANHDFAIFGTDQGGVQTLAEKMNLADVLEQSVAADNGKGDTSSTKSGSATNPSKEQVSSDNLPENQEIEEL